MFASNLRLVPWRDKDEWLNVYHDAYSGDIDRQISACQVMELWLIMRKDVPPGVECTVNLLMALTCCHQEPAATPRQLQLTLSSAILRVINMLCDNARVSEKQTMFSIAKMYNLPEWIVSLRHDVSHSQALPSLTALRSAATFLLTWLKEYYWEVEREEMRDVVLRRSMKDMCSENLDCLLDLYLCLMDICVDRPNLELAHLPPTLRLRLEDANRMRAFGVAIETMPWMRHSRESFGKELSFTDGTKVSSAVSQLLTLIQDYLPARDKRAWRADAIPSLVSRILQHSKLHSDAEKAVWGRLIQKLNSLQLLDRTALELCRNGGTGEERERWLEAVILAAAKRKRVDELWARLSLCTGRMSSRGEDAAAEAAMRRRRLGLPPDCAEKTVLSKMFGRVEKKHPELRSAIRLASSVQYLVDNCTALDILKLSASSPCAHTLRLLAHMVVLLKPEMETGRLLELTDLILIKLGEKCIGKSRTGSMIKTLSDLIPSTDGGARPVLSTGRRETSISSDSSLPSADEDIPMRDDETHAETSPEFTFVRSGWNFNGCALGVSPWQLEGSDYYDIPFDPDSAVQNQYIFPVSPHSWIPPLYNTREAE